MDYAPNAFRVNALFPLLDNEGKPFGEAEWNTLRDGMTALLLAFTDAGTVIGHWQRYTDQNRWFFWIVRSVKEVEQLKAFVHSMKEVFRQEEMFFEVHSTYYEGLR